MASFFRNGALVMGSALLGLVLAEGCSATDGRSVLSGAGPAASSGSVGGSGGGGSSGSLSLTVGTGGTGGDGGTMIIENPCGSECGPEEICDGPGAGKDDNCDGAVDEGCPCTAGAAQSCFKGDPSYLNTTGCFPGTQLCTELGIWGPCQGGVHATDNCFDANQDNCHPIQTSPFVTVDLKSGTGTFSNGAASETFEVACPAGVTPCPMVAGSNFQPVQSGEYTVTYTKTDGQGMETSCEYPLFVGAKGLRVELQWEWDYTALGGTDTVDLDLHVHKPNDTTGWGGDSGNAVDCAWDNCKAFDFEFPFGVTPDWFSGVAPPDPVDWYLDPIMENNTCYYGPKGSGADWQGIGMGCHNPRLDIDNVFCDPTVSDPQDSDFCAPENINIDYPPKNEWTRIGVHYYSNHGETYDVHPTVKIFCNGSLSAVLGPQGYGDPEAPVTFPPGYGDDRFWLVADVLFVADQCTDNPCIVEPLYLDPVAKTPQISNVSAVQTSVGPSYPPVP